MKFWITNARALASPNPYPMVIPIDGLEEIERLIVMLPWACCGLSDPRVVFRDGVVSRWFMMHV